jgi:diguanylate cyclase
LLPNTGVEGALVTAEHVREAIAAERMDTGSGYVSVTISVGVAEAVPEGDTLDRLIGRADQALNKAKQAGRNRTVVSSPTM